MKFDFWTSGRILFGPGTVDELRAIAPELGNRALLVIGRRSATESGLERRLERLIPVAATARCEREPSVREVDGAVADGRAAGCDFVVAVGGGAVLDCGKAAAGMLTNPGSLEDYLEGVGKGLKIQHPALPMVAVPTTAGTGSEVTKNAVISGPGYKKSVRSPLLIPRVALIDPELTRSASPSVTAACGMDALTQVIEPYLSNQAVPITDGLALEGIRAAGRSLLRSVEDPADLAARTDMALASVLGGICLANAGLGAVHGFASPLGALHPIPHGVACATLLPQVMRGNLTAARGTPQQGRVESRFAAVGEAFTGARYTSRGEAIDAGLAALERLQRKLGIPRLADLGITADHLPALVAGSRGSSMRYNPVELSDRQLEEILRAAI